MVNVSCFAGASFIVGSGPGGIGKTTTMRALLGFAPGSLLFAIALPEEISRISSVPCCVISHEVSEHRVPTYLWGKICVTFLRFQNRDTC
mgnify:CR=1 FL=1